MALNRRWIKLGRLFMVAWPSFFIYPVAALVTARLDPQTRIAGLALLLILALIWGWFWLRVVDPGLAAAALSSGISPLSEREREAGGRAERRRHRGDREGPLPLGRNRAQLFVVSNSEVGGQQPHRGGARRGRPGMVVALMKVGYNPQTQ
jgi:hypothetical protein